MAKSYNVSCLFGHPAVRITHAQAVKFFGKAIAKAMEADPRIKPPVLPRDACPRCTPRRSKKKR